MYYYKLELKYSLRPLLDDLVDSNTHTNAHFLSLTSLII